MKKGKEEEKEVLGEEGGATMFDDLEASETIIVLWLRVAEHFAQISIPWRGRKNRRNRNGELRKRGE